jgi:hypothetical protein
MRTRTATLATTTSRAPEAGLGATLTDAYPMTAGTA